MTTVKITIDDSLPFSDLKTVLSLIRGISKVEVSEYSDVTERQEYEQLKNSFLNSSKHSMSQHISKFIE
jgi:DNA-binding MltR family transcriptional regulator